MTLGPLKMSRGQPFLCSQKTEQRKNCLDFKFFCRSLGLRLYAKMRLAQNYKYHWAERFRMEETVRWVNPPLTAAVGGPVGTWRGAVQVCPPPLGSESADVVPQDRQCPLDLSFDSVWLSVVLQTTGHEHEAACSPSCLGQTREGRVGGDAVAELGE